MHDLENYRKSEKEKEREKGKGDEAMRIQERKLGFLDSDLGKGNDECRFMNELMRNRVGHG